MKKKLEKYQATHRSLRKLLFVMKTSALLLIISTLSLSANTYSQNLSIHVNNATLKEVVDIIKQQSEYSFVYEDAQIDLNSKVSVSLNKETISNVLEKVLAGKNINYKIRNNHIILYENKESAPQQVKMYLVQGRVLEDKEPPLPLIGVTVKIKGTSSGTVTDEGGYFKLTAKKGDILEFTYVGYKPKEFVVTREITDLDIALKENVEALGEVVVTGFSEERKLNTISSIASLDLTSNLENKPITSLSQALQGGITGLTVTQNSGLPGADAAAIKIRGISTLGFSDPLVLVDGIPMDMDNLDPTTIESVTILKDAAAAAIYGARAANGVIVIKTKRGKPGKVSVTYNGYYGIQNATYLPDFVDAGTYMDMANKAYQNTGGDPIYSPEAIIKAQNGSDPINYPNTDWKKVLYKDGAVQSHSVSVSGGSSLARFALTANYQQQDGLLKNTDFDRFSIRANTSVSLMENLSVNMDFNSYRRQRNEAMYRSNSYSSDILYYMFSTPPNVVTRYPKKDGTDITFYGNRMEMRNPAAMVDHGGRMKALEDNVSINIQPKWEIIPNLTLRGQYSYRVSSSAKNEKRDAYNFFDYNSGSLIYTWDAINTASKDRSSYYYLGGTLEYLFEKGKHRLFTIGGYNQELTNSGDWDQWALRSYYLKANYTFDRRYLLEVTMRADGSSRFGKNNKYGYFPSVAGGWNVHEEHFMKGVSFINNLKVRGSYGLLGNENIGLYKYQSLIDAGNGVENVFGNPNITWEKVHMLNIGADLGIFKDFRITFDYYDKLTSDMIITPPLSLIGGMGSAPINSGKVRNRGWELDVNYGKSYRNFSFNVHAGLSQNKNKIEDLFGGPYDNGGTIHKVGYSLYSHYLYQTKGLLQESDFTGKDAAGQWVPKAGVIIFDGQQPGDIHYIDQNDDKKIDPKDRVIMGDGEPKLNYFGNISLNYKKWDFEVLFQGVTGVDAYYSDTYRNGMSLEGDGSTPLTVQTDYWTPQNTGARYPRLAPKSSYGKNDQGSDYWFFDAGYCRVKYIQLGYTFDYMALKKVGISRIRAYINTQNPFTIAKEQLVDPENRGGQSSYPLLRTYSFGLSLSF